MGYLYFQPKFALRTNAKWLQQLHEKVISALGSCSKIEEVKHLHAFLIRTGLILEPCFASGIVSYFSVPSTHFNMEYARRIFDQVHHPDVYMWNLMIRGYTEDESSDVALSLFKQMLGKCIYPDSYTYPAVLKACCRRRSLETGRMLHGQILKWGFNLCMIAMSGLVNLYGCCGRIDLASYVFEEMPERDVVSWTTLIFAYVQLNCSKEAFLLFDKMASEEGVEPNKVTLLSLLAACTQWPDLDRGRWFHSYIVKNGMGSNLVVCNSLVNMYAKCGSISCALQVFNNMPKKNSVSWNALIGGLCQSGLAKEALELFWQMDEADVRPTEITVVNALSACTKLADLVQGRRLHGYIKECNIKYDLIVNNALITMYVKCGDLEQAFSVFSEAPERDVFSWTAIIAGYVQTNRFREALALFQEMQHSQVKPNEITLVSLLSACAQTGALNQGKQVHSYINENNVKQDVYLGNALVDMYAKCGSIETASSVFHHMSNKDTFSWNVMIGGLAIHGRALAAIDLFSKMEIEGVTKPDHVTFTAVLSACAHSGMLSEGYKYFDSMSRLYNIAPRIEHYGCMVDLLGRAGLVDEATKIIYEMPFEPNLVIWGSVLAACRVHHKVNLGEKAARKILELAPDEEGALVLLFNIYAEAGKWDDAKRVRGEMGGLGIEKSPGYSSIEVDGVVHEFLVQDSLHQEHDHIYSLLTHLQLQLRNC